MITEYDVKKWGPYILLGSILLYFVDRVWSNNPLDFILEPLFQSGFFEYFAIAFLGYLLYRAISMGWSLF